MMSADEPTKELKDALTEMTKTTVGGAVARTRIAREVFRKVADHAWGRFWGGMSKETREAYQIAVMSLDAEGAERILGIELERFRADLDAEEKEPPK